MRRLGSFATAMHSTYHLFPDRPLHRNKKSHEANKAYKIIHMFKQYFSVTKI